MKIDIVEENLRFIPEDVSDHFVIGQLYATVETDCTVDIDPVVTVDINPDDGTIVALKICTKDLANIILQAT